MCVSTGIGHLHHDRRQPALVGQGQQQFALQRLVFGGIVLFAHQGFSTNLFGCVVDVFPAKRVASVVSIGALAGNLWGAAVLEITGRVLAGGGSYLPMFMAAGSGYLVSAFLIRALMLKPLRVPAAA